MSKPTMTFDSAPVQQDTSVTGRPAPGGQSSGMTFDSAPVQQDTHAQAQQPARVEASAAPAGTEQPGFLDRLYETSGAKGIVDLGKAAFSRPVDLYHEAVEQATKGDMKGATETALKIMNIIPDQKHPLVQAAKQIVMHPIEEMKASYKENRAAGHGKIASATTPVSVYEGMKTLADKTQKDYAEGNYAGIIGDIVGAPTESHIAGATPLVGAAVQQVGGNVDKDLHDRNYSAVAGDILGPLLTMGMGKVAGMIGEAAEGTAAASKAGMVDNAVARASGELAPKVADIAGENVPVARTNPQFNPTQSRAVRIAKNFATDQGAKDFVAEQAQPAAVRATQANLTKSAFNTIDELRKIKGEATTDVNPPAVETTSDLTKVLKSAAKPTYEVLDKAAEGDIAEWNSKYGPDSGYTPPQSSKILGPDGKPVSSGVEPEVAPPKPMTFTELQDQLGEAQDTLKSTASSQVDKQWAKENLPIFKQQLSDFLEKHGDKVDASELEHANKAYAQAGRYDFIAKKLRTASTGVEEGNLSSAETPGLKPESLKSIPKAYDNKFGAGEWKKLLGEDGVKNYNDILNALKTPETGGSSFIEFLRNIPGVGKAVAAHGLPGVSRIADSLLFNPEAGQTALRLWKIQKTRAAALTKLAAKTAARVEPVQALPAVGGLTPDVQSTPSPAQAPMDAAQSALSGETNPSLGGGQSVQATSRNQPVVVTPSFTDRQSMVAPGNIDLNTRPKIKNPDGSTSTVFSMSFGTDDGEVLVPGVGDGKTYPLRKLTPKEALDQYRKTGKNLGTFRTPEAADRYGELLHDDQAK